MFVHFVVPRFMEEIVFNKELTNFKKKVEEAMKYFFNFTPEEVLEEIEKIKNEYGKFCDLDNTSFREVLVPKYKDILMKYKTLVYFRETYDKLLEIENFLKEDLK